MKGSASLLGLNVGDYFKLCNWQLLPPPSDSYLPKQAKITPPQRPTVLSALSVKEFFDSCNWQLLRQNEPENDNDSTSPLLPQVESNFQNPPIVLPCLTVAEFFSLCNWQSIPLEVRKSQPLPLEQEPPLKQESPLTIQVQIFLQMISWEGNPEIGRLPQASRSPCVTPAEVEMSLNDLSKLF